MTESYLYILDTGYVANKDRTLMTQNVVADRAGLLSTDTAVSHMTIELKSIAVATSINSQEEANIGQKSDNKINVISAKNPILSINFIIDRDRTSDAYKYGFINQLIELEKTSGLKLIHMIDYGKNLVWELGSKNVSGYFSDSSPNDMDGTVTTATHYLLGKFKNFNFGDTNTNIYNCSVNFVIEK